MKEGLSDLIKRRLNELDMSKAELARLVGVSRSYINNMANATAPTQSGQYEPSPKVLSALAKALDIPETEILRSIDYISENALKRKPQTVAEFVQRLEEMGFGLRFDSEDLENLGPDDLQDLLDQIEANLLVKTRRKR